MMASTTFITRHPLLTYFALTFAISWGGFVLVVGPRGFPGTGSQFDALLPLVASAMLAGPAVASILLIVLLSGTAGLRELLSRLLRWRVGARWYVAALLPAPVLAAAALFALSLTSPIFTAESKAAILLAGITAGLTTVLEEVGWTGFAVPRPLRRHDVVATGLIVGVVATLMHGSLTASTVLVFTPAATGASFLIYISALAGAMWIVVPAVALASSGQLSRRPLQRRMA